MKFKSPFYIVEEFISPLACEDIIQRLDNKLPNRNVDGEALKTVRSSQLTELRILPDLKALIPKLETYYGFKYLGTQPFEFEWYVEGCKDQSAQCANSNLVRRKWIRTNDKDFVGVIFLNDYRDKQPFDPDYEVVGGKLAFPTHGFSFNPKRGQLVVFPGNQFFVHGTSKVFLGELNQIRFHITSEDDYQYDPKQFPGTYKEWFS